MIHSIWTNGCNLDFNEPSFYKIPTICDLPHALNIDLLERKTKSAWILGSKACSESSIDLALSVPFAILDAIKSLRSDSNSNDFSDLHFPLSEPRIKQLVEQFKQ